MKPTDRAGDERLYNFFARYARAGEPCPLMQYVEEQVRISHGSFFRRTMRLQKAGLVLFVEEGNRWRIEVRDVGVTGWTYKNFIEPKRIVRSKEERTRHILKSATTRAENKPIPPLAGEEPPPPLPAHPRPVRNGAADVTAVLCGDPVPGRSALDEMRAGGRP